MRRAVSGPLTWPNGQPRSTNNAFDLLYLPRGESKEHVSRGQPGQPSKVQQAAMALMSEAERQAYRNRRAGLVR